MRFVYYRMLDKRALLFDFDYTLADSSEAIVECFNHAFKSCGLPTVPPEKIYPLIGISLPESFKLLNKVTEPVIVDELRLHFRTRGDQIALEMTHLYDATKEVIPSFHRSGYRLGIVSTKYSYRIMAVLKRHNLDRYFDEIVGGGDVEKHKPHPEGLHLILERMDLNRDEAVYIGDSTADAEAAQSAGLDFMAVLTGVTGREKLSNYAPLAIVENLNDLKQLIMQA